MKSPKIGKQLKVEIDSRPFRGGANTAQEKALLGFGGFSMIQNMRQKHPGMEKRKGFTRKHTTALTGTPKILSLYQFNKAKRDESHFFAQASDDDIYKATDNPPTVTTGVFGTAVLTGSASSLPAAWSNIEELCLFSNGVDQHKVSAGTANYVKKFVKYDSDAALPNIPEDGYDYTTKVTNDSILDVAVLDSLNTYANHECILICTPVPANKLTWTFYTGRENDTAAVGTLKYRKSDNTWVDTEEDDGTSKGDTDTLGQNGSMTWSQPTDEIPCYMFGTSGFWYLWETATQLDAEVEVVSVTYGTDGTATKTFESIVNVWNGWPVYAIEARVQLDTDEPYDIYGSDTVEIDEMVLTNGKVYFNSYDKIAGFYVDPGETPNTTTSTINAVYCWNGHEFTSVGTITDGTAGMSKAGWVTWGRTAVDEQPTQFDTSRYYSYWYYFTVSATLSDDVIISIETMPYFDINEVGRKGYVNAAWKGRAVYNFGDQYGFVSAKGVPMVLNGDDFGIIEAGDGRVNRWTCTRQFHNELMVWQEEKGKEGGCLTLFEGDEPKNFGKLLLSSRLGCVNAKSAVVVDGVLVSTTTDETLKTIAFWISRYGICATDGRTCSIISDDIGNYFDPKETSTCIRKGYENEHWMEGDSADNVLRIGLVCGASATTPNVFPIFDLKDKTFSFDTYSQNFSCMTEAEAKSGNIPVLQYAGGTDDGAIYQLNTGTDDVDISNTSTLIADYVMMEFGADGKIITIREMILRCKAQSAGNITITPYLNGIAQTARTFSMIAAQIGETIRRHREDFWLTDSQISLKLENATESQSLYLLDMGLKVYDKSGR